ncbi:SIMPL domain-containing protein [Undibacterium sp. Di27W]|uniref:SIMPL domain-containing protein n=1 Tax=Undibacterium sp. Di27W TaxID=3413036 RepID=UPI003BF582E5
MMRHCLLMLIFALIPMYGEAGTLPAYPFIHVNGSASIVLPTNMAELDFELTALTSNADESLALLNTQSELVLAFLLDHKIAGTDIAAHDTKKMVSGDEMANSNMSLQRYRLIRAFHVYVKNFDDWNVLTQFLLSRPGLGNFSMRFGRTDYAQIETDLTFKAAENARDRAKELAAGFSVKLLGPTAVSEQALSRVESELGLDGAKIVQTNATASDKPTMSDLSLPGVLMYKKTVNVIFRTR